MKPSDIIGVKFSEDLAQYAEARPVRRQPMSLRELVGLVLTSTGKHPARLSERLQSGTCLYNIYRYWWDGFTIEPATLDAILAEFPDPDPARPFHPAACAWMRLYDAQEPVPHSLAIEPPEARRRRWFRRESYWDFLLAFARARPLIYLDYSYYHHADLYRTALAAADRDLLLEQSRRLARRPLARQLARGREWVWLELACLRSTASRA